MKKTLDDGRVFGLPLDNFKLRKLVVSLGNTYVRRRTADRRKVMRALKQFAFGKAKEVSYWDRWSKEDAKRCYLLLKPISPKMANDVRRWASELLKTGNNNKLALKCLMDELEIRTWIEEA